MSRGVSAKQTKVSRWVYLLATLAWMMIIFCPAVVFADIPIPTPSSSSFKNRERFQPNPGSTKEGEYLPRPTFPDTRPLLFASLLLLGISALRRNPTEKGNP